MDVKTRLVKEVQKRYEEGDAKPRRYEHEDDKSISARITEASTRYGGKVEAIPGMAHQPLRYKNTKHTDTRATENA